VLRGAGFGILPSFFFELFPDHSVQHTTPKAIGVR
jgi:hypothetical protein